MSRLEQREKIMLRIFKDYAKTKQARFFSAIDFQDLVGYEASARMSEIYDDFPHVFDRAKSGRFRLLGFRGNRIKEMLKMEKEVKLRKHSFINLELLFIMAGLM